MTSPLPLLAAAAVTALSLLAVPAQVAAQAADWPTKPVRILTPFPPGAGPETVTRMLAEKLGKMWGKPVIVENRPGGNGFIAIDAFKRGDKDGYDLIQLDNVHLSAYPSLFKKLPYDPQKDFELVAPLFKAAFFFTVPTNSPYKTVADLVADAKAKPGKLNYGSWSVGNPVHLGSALFETLTGTQMEHVIYKETSQLYLGVANGELAFALGSSGTSGALQRGGRIRYLAVAGPKRLPAFPDVPTAAEAGGPSQLRGQRLDRDRRTEGPQSGHRAEDPPRHRQGARRARHRTTLCDFRLRGLSRHTRAVRRLREDRNHALRRGHQEGQRLARLTASRPARGRLGRVCCGFESPLSPRYRGRVRPATRPS